MQYPAKVLLAWGEAISGNREIRDWLMQNGYPELALTCHALHLDDVLGETVALGPAATATATATATASC